jgi:hypothetical protein
MLQQVSRYNHHNTVVHPGRFYFNPFLDNHDNLILMLLMMERVEDPYEIWVQQ